MKVKVLKKKFEEEKDRYGFDTDLFELLEEKETKGKYVEFTFDIQKTWEKGVFDREDLEEHFQRFLVEMAKIGVVEIHFSSREFATVLRKIKELDKKNRVITLADDLSFNCIHPKLPSDLSCWKQDYEIGEQHYALRFPVYWLRDFETLKANQFIFQITEQQRATLRDLAEKQRSLINDVYFFPSVEGFVVFAHGINSDLLDDIQKKTRIQYNITDESSGQLKAVTLNFAKRVHFSEAENGEEENENPYATKNVMYLDLQTKGYEAYDCKMFVLPSLEQAFRKRDVKITGVDQIYPVFPKFDFTVHLIEKHPEFKSLTFQQEAFSQWEQNGMLGTVALPTGSGKTLIALRAIASLKTKTLIVTPTIEMVFQWRDMLMKWLHVPKEHIGLYYADEKEIRDITIITFQSGHRRVFGEVAPEEEIKADESLLDEIGKLSETVGLLIMDEGHHAPAPIFQRIMVNLKSRYRMSLTATPYREDKNEVLAFLAIGDVVYTKDYASLAEEKVVSPIEFNRCLLPFTELETDIIGYKAKFQAGYYWQSDGYSSYKKDDEANRDTVAMLELWSEHPYIILRESVGLHTELRDSRQVQIRQLLGFTTAKFDKLLEVVRANQNRKILIFNEFVDGAKIIAHYLDTHDLPCHVLTGSTNPKERASIFKDFKEQANFILVTTTVLDEGINVPDCDVVVIFNASRSKRQMIQRIGRGCRYQKGKIEKVYEFVSAPADYPSNDSHHEYGRDKWILERMKMKRELGGAVNWRYQLDQGYYGSHLLQVTEREIMLYEIEKSIYRNVEEVINVEKQKELIAKVGKEKA